MTKSRNILARRKPWTGAEIERLRAYYPHKPTAQIAAALGRTLSQVRYRATALGLRKTAKYLASPAACRLRGGSDAGLNSRFKPGHEVWNKGMQYTAGGRSGETRFKAGAAPHNTVPLGSYRLDGDGTLQRKISEASGSNSTRWRGVHELVWVQANGPRPAGHIVVFKPGMRTNVLEQITIDRLDCISLAENMKRNTLHNMPKELAELVQLRGAITRQINKREKAHEHK